MELNILRCWKWSTSACSSCCSCRFLNCQSSTHEGPCQRSSWWIHSPARLFENGKHNYTQTGFNVFIKSKSEYVSTCCKTRLHQPVVLSRSARATRVSRSWCPVSLPFWRLPRRLDTSLSDLHTIELQTKLEREDFLWELAIALESWGSQLYLTQL